MSARRDPLRSQPLTPTTIRNARETQGPSRYEDGPKSRLRRRPDDGQQMSFPAHPSVRIPPNAKARGLPMGVGVAPRPTMASPATYSQNTTPRQQEANTPKTPALAWDASQASSRPLSRVMHDPPPVPPSTSASRRYNMTQSYVSSINAETPSLKQSNPERDSHYPDDNLSPRAAYPSSKLMPQFEFPTPDNRATMQTIDSYDHFTAKPRPIDTSMQPPTMMKPGEISPASTRAHAMNALSQAIAIGINQPSMPVSPITTSRPFSPPVRMPFDDDMSVHTTTEDLDPPELKDAPPVPKSKLTVRDLSASPTSAHSEAPILGRGIGTPARGMSTAREASKRPPRLDIDAVRDMEARGSTTSLTDLIKRATKLASNLDRGKTASRLGMLDMFGRSSERLGNLPPGKRDSSMSDMLSAFPAPAIGTPRSEWPATEKGFNSSTGALPQWKSDTSSDSSKAKKTRRRICGMSVPCFTVVMIILILLVAAAVLIPIFLIVVPRQSNSNASAQPATVDSCARTNKCQNSGTTIVTNDACGCICSGGFTGTDCATQGDSSCTTRDIRDGNTIYRAATMAQQVLQGFTDAGTFNITLNATTILSQFSANNVPCREADSLLDINESADNATSSTSATGNNASKRETAPEPFVMLKGYEPPPLPVHPHRVGDIHPNNSGKKIVPAAPLITSLPNTPANDDKILLPRQNSNSLVSNDLFTEVNGIVFDTSRGTATSVSFTPSATAASPSATGSGGTSSSSSSSNTPADLTDQLAFARVAVLYILDRSQSLSTALDAKNRLSEYFESVGSQNEVQVGMVAGLMVTVDMSGLTLLDGSRVVNGGVS